jgi:hypothetical protein
MFAGMTSYPPIRPVPVRTGAYRPPYSQREKDLFGEITEAENILADALGMDRRARYDQTVTTLALKAAEVIAYVHEQGLDADTMSARELAAHWAANIESWLQSGVTDGQSPDYAQGFADGWSHAARMLRSLIAGMEHRQT